jgi:AcrR family transcriptional regulator
MQRQVPAPSPPRAVRPRVVDAVLDATLVCITRVGVAKTTLDDVAREAGCARATVYRYFPGKQPLVNAVVAREADRLTVAVLAAAEDADDLAGAATAVLTAGATSLLRHDALRFVLTVEPEVLLPHISFARGDDLLAECAQRVAPAFTRFIDEDHALRLAEWVVRIGLSYLCSPEAADLVDTVRVHALVEDFVLPGLDQSVSSEGIIPT